MTTTDEIAYVISVIIVMTLLIRWIMRRGVPNYDNVWLEFVGFIAGLNLIVLSWGEEDWIGVAIFGLWTVMTFVRFSQAFDADKAKRLTSAGK